MPVDILTVFDALLWGLLRIAMAAGLVAGLVYLVAAISADIIRWRARR